MEEQSTPATDVESTPIDADAVNAELIGTDDTEGTGTPNEDSGDKSEHQDTQDADRADASTSPIDGGDTEKDGENGGTRPPVDASLKAKKSADRKITQLGQELAEVRRIAEEREQRYIQRDAGRIMSDPYEYGRMLKHAASEEDFAYLRKVYDALPGPHKNAAKAQEDAYNQEKYANESPEERDQRIAAKIEAELERKMEQKYAPFVERQMQQARSENERVLTEFRATHNITDDEFVELEPKMLPFYKAAREAFPDLSDPQLLERALIAVEPERVKRASRAEALIQESDRRAATMVHGTTGSASSSQKQESAEERYVREKMEGAFATRMKHYQK